MWESVVYRVAAWDTPLWALHNRSPARFNYAGQGQTQYLALHPLTPWAEIGRNQERVSANELSELRLPVWALRIILDVNPERIGFAEAASWGLSAEELVADDHSACRRLAEQLRTDAAAPKAIIVPSAALPGTESLVIFGARVRIGYLDSPIDEEDVPLSLAALRARPPLGLESLIHPKSSPTDHPALDAWLSGDDFEFTEPATRHLTP